MNEILSEIRVGEMNVICGVCDVNILDHNHCMNQACNVQGNKWNIKKLFHFGDDTVI